LTVSYRWKKKSNFLRRVGGGTAGTLIGRPFGKELPSLLERMNRDAGKPIHPNDEGVFAKAGLDPVGAQAAPGLILFLHTGHANDT
jgi:hypothetical protein